MSDYIPRITAIGRVWGAFGGAGVYVHAMHDAMRCDAMRCDAMRCDAMWDVACKVRVSRKTSNERVGDMYDGLQRFAFVKGGYRSALGRVRHAARYTPRASPRARERAQLILTSEVMVSKVVESAW